jgi:hypothetical protein
LVEIALTGRRQGRDFGSEKRGQQDCGENCNNGDNHQKFNQGKSRLTAAAP